MAERDDKRKQPVAFIRPPKPISDMTEEELDAFAEGVVGVARDRADEPAPDAAPEG